MSAQRTPIPSPPALRIDGLQLNHRDHVAVRDLCGEFAPGSLTAIVGPNGAGKSSLLAALAGVLAPVRGRIERVGGTSQRLAWLPQHSALEREAPITLAELVGLGAWPEMGAWRAFGRRGRERLGEALEVADLRGLERRLVAELSAGQFQRALFARVLMQDAPLILLDEPFNAMDAATTAALLMLVARWHAEGRTVIAVLHDAAQVRTHFPSCLLLDRRALAWGPSAEVLDPGAPAWLRREPAPMAAAVREAA